MTVHAQDVVQKPAVVARPPMRPTDADQYLMLSPQGAAAWTTDPKAATAFESMKEAMRAALRLPSSVRAFSLPLRSELTAGALH